jgi:hypothetical protein
LKKPRHNRWKNLELRKLKPKNAQHLTSFSKINSNRKHFRTLKSSSKDGNSTYQDKPQELNYHQVINNNQQQGKDRETETAENSQDKERKIEGELTSQ